MTASFSATRRIAAIAVLIALASVTAACGTSSPRAQAPSPSSTAAPAPTAGAPATTVFGAGIHITGTDQPDDATADVRVLGELGVSYTRTQVTVGQSDQAQSAQYAAWTKAGIHVLLNIYNKSKQSPTIQNKSGMNKPIAGPPTDLGAYRTQVGKLLDTYRPALVVVENEENGRYYSGTPSQYAAELEAAVEVAHAKGYRVADGGLTGVPLSLIVWKDYWDRGMRAQADDFARRAFAPNTKAASIYAQLPSSAAPDRPFPPNVAELPTQYAWTVQALQLLRTTGADYINFHWYQDDPGAFGEVAAYLHRVTGKPVMCNEAGSSTDSPSVVTGVLQAAVDAKLAYLNWFSAERTATSTDEPLTKALQNPDGTLRPTGQAFATFVRSHS